MDLNLFAVVLWRHKRLVLGGVVLGVVLAVLAYGTPSFSSGPSLKPRSGVTWQSESQLLISQAGFPYKQTAEATEPSRYLGSLSPIYANLLNGGDVQAEIRHQLGSSGSVKASEDVDTAASTFLPFVNILATAPTASEATKLAQGAATVFQAYVARQQATAEVPAGKRIQLAIVESGANTKLAEGHKLSVPILVFVAVLLGTLALVFIKENVDLSSLKRAATGELSDRHAAPESAESRDGVPLDGPVPLDGHVPLGARIVDTPLDGRSREPHTGVGARAHQEYAGTSGR